MIKRYSLSFLFCVTPLFANQAAIDDLAANLQVKYTLIDAMPVSCPEKLKKCYLSELVLTVPSDAKYNDFSIFFSQLMPIYSVESEHFSISHINGDLHKITPKRSLLDLITQKLN